MRKLFKGKKRAVGLGVIAVLLGAVAAFAYFTSLGSGTGSAKTGSAVNLQISQVGAGYDSLVAGSDPYIQDQCFQCAQITEFGNDITLANAGDQQLVNVVVAFRNWGAAFSGVPITLSINNTVAGPISDTETPSFAAASGPDTPSLTNVTFNFAAQGAFVQQEFVYGISFDASGAAGGLNVALSNSANDLSVGTDTHSGTVWVDTTAGSGIAGDFPSCTTPGVGFAQVNTACGDASLTNPGAYGTSAQVAAGNADIPAVEVNVVGGIVTGLTPGGPSEPVDYAITNPGASPEHVNQVTTTFNSVTTNTIPGLESCATSMYSITNGPAINANVPPGTTVYSPSGTTILMKDDSNNQDNCEGATVSLSFTSN
jgi:hypothetical protein